MARNSSGEERLWTERLSPVGVDRREQDILEGEGKRLSIRASRNIREHSTSGSAGSSIFWNTSRHHRAGAPVRQGRTTGLPCQTGTFGTTWQEAADPVRRSVG